MRFGKNRGEIAKVMDELAMQVNQGMRRPMNLILTTIEQIKRMKFTPEDDANIAEAFRDGMAEVKLMPGLYSDAQVRELADNLDKMRKRFSAKAIR
jgi:hypothetical protein